MTDKVCSCAYSLDGSPEEQDPDCPVHPADQGVVWIPINYAIQNRDINSWWWARPDTSLDDPASWNGPYEECIEAARAARNDANAPYGVL